jgi:steroid delta-isomerase-like uncharacterized protein
MANMPMVKRRAVLAAAPFAPALVASCVRAPESPTAEAAKGYMAAWNARDADRAAAFLADDVYYLDVTVGEPQHGRDGARENVIRLFMTAAPDLKWEMNGEPIVSDDGIAFEWTFSGTNTGPWGPQTPATNRPFRFEGVTFLRVKDGKITYQGDYYDGYAFQKQLGWVQ